MKSLLDLVRPGPLHPSSRTPKTTTKRPDVRIVRPGGTSASTSVIKVKK